MKGHCVIDIASTQVLTELTLVVGTTHMSDENLSEMTLSPTPQCNTQHTSTTTHCHQHKLTFTSSHHAVGVVMVVRYK